LSGDEWPEVGELVIATVETITPYGAYVTLDEYGRKRGFLHISEISTSWVRNIREHIRENMKLVLKVLRVNPVKRHIDLSLKRVSDRERKEELYYWKRRVKGRNLLKLVAKKIGKPYEQLYSEYGKRLEAKFGDLYEVFSILSEKGVKPLLKLDVPEELAKAFYEVASEKIKPKIAKLRGIVEVSTVKPDGVYDVKEALMRIEKLSRDDIKVEVYAIGPPRYAVEVTAKDYKTASRVLKEAFRTVERFMKRRGGTVSFREA